MTRHYTDLGTASDWLKQLSLAAQPVRSTTQTWVVPRHQYRISVVVSQMLFSSETSGGIAICWLFSEATNPSARHSANRVWQNWSRSQVCRGIFFQPALHSKWIARLQIIWFLHVTLLQKDVQPHVILRFWHVHWQCVCKCHALQTGLRAQTIRVSQKHVHVSLENISSMMEGPRVFRTND